ncbi:MAG: FtsQ-type POTRA domain-containing protein [Acutalibacteraceae bacterium]|nr:FtsQ-type POTRA domain-containing protein [Acutalibacteraceae bacterium]
MANINDSALEERRRAIQNKRKAAKLRRRKILLKRLLVLLCILAVITVAILSITVFFPIEKITVDAKTDKYTPEEIIKASGIEKGQNLWMAGLNAEEDIPKKLPLISKATIKRKLPANIIIQTENAKAVYCFKNNKVFFICDAEYKILEKVKKSNNKLIGIVGAEIGDNKAGEKLVFKSEDKQELLKTLLSLLKNKNIKISSVDITNNVDIKIGVEKRLNILLGSSVYLEAKIAHLAGMLEKVDKDTKGSIDLSDYTPENHRGILKRE